MRALGIRRPPRATIHRHAAPTGPPRGHRTALQVDKPLGNLWSASPQGWRTRRQREESQLNGNNERCHPGDVAAFLKDSSQSTKKTTHFKDMKCCLSFGSRTTRHHLEYNYLAWKPIQCLTLDLCVWWPSEELQLVVRGKSDETQATKLVCWV